MTCLYRNSTLSTEPFIPSDAELYKIAEDWATGHGYRVVRVLNWTVLPKQP